MEIIIRPDEQAVAASVADIFDAAIRAADGKGLTLGLATGSSPVKTYAELIRRHREEGLSFAGVRAFLLDEYIGLPRTHEQSYYRFIRDNFTSHVDLEDSLVQSPHGEAEDPITEAARYDQSIVDAGGSIFRSSALEPMDTSGSTSRVHLWPLAPGLRPSQSRRSGTTHGSLTLLPKSQSMFLPRGLEPLWMLGTSCSQRPVNTRRKRWPPWWKVRSARAAQVRFCRCTGLPPW